MNRAQRELTRRGMARSVRIALVACCVAVVASAVRGDNREFRAIKPAAATVTASAATWDVPDPRTVREAAFAFLASRGAADDVVARAETLWPEEGETRDGELLDRAAAVVALAEPKAADAVNYAKGAGPVTPWPHSVWLLEREDKDEASWNWVRGNLRLLVARRLVEARRFEDVLHVLGGLDAGDMADPAALLFARAVAEHQLVRPEACAATAATLLENERLIPTRYAAVARLLRADIEGVKRGSLDDIARRMGHVGRRIEIGQAGPRTNDLADEVVKSLDDLIKKAEDERQKQNAAAGRGQASGQPAQESRPLEGKGEGKVDHKPTGTGRDWGNLPAKVRDAALQQIGKDFPAHYREIIEEYFRRLAAEEE